MFGIFNKANAFSGLKRAFPKEMMKDVELVCIRLSAMGTYAPVSSFSEAYILSDGEVFLPYRCYFEPLSEEKLGRLTELQMNIYACIALLHPDGYFREKYLRLLLKNPIEEWMLPFLLKLSGEYVKEILAALYEFQKDQDNTVFREFCVRNPRQAQRNYGRMVTFWDEYYRFDIVHPVLIEGRKGVKTRLRDYVGYLLFRKCWGVSPRRKRV